MPRWTPWIAIAPCLVLAAGCEPGPARQGPSTGITVPTFTTLPTTITTSLPPDGDNDGYTADEDCDDGDQSVHPGAPELCDAIDNDCDGFPGADEADDDGDGFRICAGDCNDAEERINPDAVETRCDGIDNDCSPSTADARDLDGDHHDECEDCDDGNPGTHPDANEIQADGVDQDCDGGDLCLVDEDQDGWGEEGTVPSDDLDCDDPGEARVGGDRCLGADDNVDPDLDGVPSGCDPCPLDFLDDSDGDGSCDGEDLCPGANDRLDTDEDGVPNGCDDCSSPQDTDGDTVPDDCDLCPGHPDHRDADADGTPDGCDACATGDTDSDGDGVCDDQDACPGGDDRADDDQDGVPDDCDGDTGSGTTDADGDGDGVPDAVDPDPGSPGGAGARRPPRADLGCACTGDPRPASGGIALLAAMGILARRRRGP